ncbi:DMP19 family protein [Prevotella sp. 10(H)]|uniref:DMP19 family protein n=1 Tax=Prevotella sp. 10(H) TaxID=1158294 RepID=UPI000691BDF5|nr:DMP19 family protein [Prevotella sp. 10(H)]
MLKKISSLLSGIFGCKPKNGKSDINREVEDSLTAFKNRRIYKKLTKEIIDSVSDDDLVQVVFDNICTCMKPDYSNDYDVVIKLSAGQQSIYSTWCVEAEVNNGGFNQFYFNSSERFADMAVNGFLLIGAEQHYKLMKEANKVYSENKEKLGSYNDGTLQSFSESYKDNPLKELDKIFYELEEDLNELRVKYIRVHYQEFIQ